MTFGRLNGDSSAIRKPNEQTASLRRIQKPCDLSRSHLRQCLTVGPVDIMPKFFWWIRRDRDGHKRIELAREENRILIEQIENQTADAKERAAKIRAINRRNHLAELFQEEFGRKRD